MALQAVPKISDYALIGDSRCAALVSNTGSIDYLCLPRFDSPSLFNRILDGLRGGYFSIRPSGAYTVRRYYLGDTNLLVTEFETPSGRVRLTDFMPVLSEEEKKEVMIPFRSLIRRVEGLEGRVAMEAECVPRPDDGRLIPRFSKRGGEGYFSDLGGALLHLATGWELDLTREGLYGTRVVDTGDQSSFWLAYSSDAPAVYPRLHRVGEMEARSVSYWKGWAERCNYHGPYRSAVVRSALVLKLLSFAPSNAIVAAPTTSLPEAIGSSRNWDYRYCWLRDASFTAQVFFRLGYTEEPAGFVQWLMHATRLTQPALKVVYDIYGRITRPQKDVEFLEGYLGSRPVRIGNNAEGQYQLDIYGEVLDALWLYAQSGLRVDREMQKNFCGMADYVADHWTYPDHGIWEVPGPRRHYVHSKVLCWVALNRAGRLAQRLGVRHDRARWERVGRQIGETVLKEGFNPGRGSFTQTLGGSALDATAYIFPLVGFIDAKDPLMEKTVGALERELCRDDLVYRYRMDDGLPGEEGAFLACAFWRVEALCALGRHADAARLFEKLSRRANEVGLYSEEIAPKDGLFLGNFPQALSHLSHIAAALRLSDHNL
ncbi:MAG TPA: glycoside hydrolase family 15 protein [Candidatus Manganitrophaceae bacterium]|nr:glycoside hydrolase family 15 protein [Candidatus Manganitrophaceae bacterium]